MATNNPYFKYFMFSSTQLKKKIELATNIGQTYVPGKVFIGNNVKQFTDIISDPKNSTYSDSIIVTRGDTRNINYKEDVG